MSARTMKIKLKATNAHPHRKEGEVFEVHPSQEAMLRERQWAVGENDKNTKAENPAIPKSAAAKTTEGSAPAAAEPGAEEKDKVKK